MPTERTARWLRFAWVAGIAAFLVISIMPLSRSPLPEVAMADKAAAEQGIPSTEAVLTSEMLDESE